MISLSLFLPGAGAGTYMATLRVKNGTTGCESSVYNISVTINALPTATISGTVTICAGQSTNLTFSSATGTSFTYSDGTTTSGTVPFASGTAAVSVNPASTTTYTIASVSDGTCTNSSVSGSAVVTVNTIPAFTTCTGAQTAAITSNCATAVTYSTIPVASGMPAPTLTYTFTGATTVAGNGDGSGESFNKGITHVTVKAAMAAVLTQPAPLS